MAENKSLIEERKKFNKLLSRIAKKDESAFREFHEKYGKFIKAVALAYVRQEFIADDVVDQVHVRVWRNAVKKGKVDKPLGWLYRITKNCALDILNEEEISADADGIAVDDNQFDKFISDNTFYGHLSMLNPEEQQILIMKMVRDMIFEDIADELNKPLSTVSSTYYRALEKMKTKIF